MAVGSLELALVYRIPPSWATSRDQDAATSVPPGQRPASSRPPYPSDLTDGQWAILVLLVAAPNIGGRAAPSARDPGLDWLCLLYDLLLELSGLTKVMN